MFFFFFSTFYHSRPNCEICAYTCLRVESKQRLVAHGPGALTTKLIYRLVSISTGLLSGGLLHNTSRVWQIVISLLMVKSGINYLITSQRPFVEWVVYTTRKCSTPAHMGSTRRISSVFIPRRVEDIGSKVNKTREIVDHWSRTSVQRYTAHCNSRRGHYRYQNQEQQLMFMWVAISGGISLRGCTLVVRSNISNTNTPSPPQCEPCKYNLSPDVATATPFVFHLQGTTGNTIHQTKSRNRKLSSPTIGISGQNYYSLSVKYNRERNLTVLTHHLAAEYVA